MSLRLDNNIRAVVGASGISFKTVKRSNGTVLWQSGNNVTYFIDSNNVRSEEVSYGNSVLSPTSFTPTKSGYDFVGWREDTTASASVLSSKTMGDSPISLYAVFRKTVTVTYCDNAPAKSTSGYLYYNNGNTLKPVFKLTCTSFSDWTTRGWSTSTEGNATISYQSDVAFERDSDVTLYSSWVRTVTVTLYDNSATQRYVTGTAYRNYNAEHINAKITLTQASKSGWSARGWSLSNVADASINISNGGVYDGYTDKTYYGCYQQTVTLTYAGNGATGGSVAAESKTKYYNSSGATSSPTFTLKANGFTRTDYTFTGWSLGAVGAVVELSQSTTANAQWSANSIYVIQNGAITRSDYVASADLTKYDIGDNDDRTDGQGESRTIYAFTLKNADRFSKIKIRYEYECYFNYGECYIEINGTKYHNTTEEFGWHENTMYLNANSCTVEIYARNDSSNDSWQSNVSFHLLDVYLEP